jgi:hypothetical protein
VEEDEFFGPVISRYTARDAVEDGIFIEVGSFGKEPVYFTTNLFESGGYEEHDVFGSPALHRPYLQPLPKLDDGFCGLISWIDEPIVRDCAAPVGDALFPSGGTSVIDCWACRGPSFQAVRRKEPGGDIVF